jgi:beta-galactosidase
VDGKRVAALDRRHNQDATRLNITGESATLDILVENGGRINYGGRLPDNRKGITESVMLGDRELTGWEMYKLPFDSVSWLHFGSTPASAAPAAHRGTFKLSQLNCFRQRAQSGPLLADRPAADALSARSLAQERPQ